jgi:DNA-binding FrmR family transcriptional regulator
VFKNLTFKNKYKLLLLSGAVMVFVIYLLAIKKTIDRKNECEDLIEQLEVVETAPEQMARLRMELSRVEGIIGNEDGSELDFRQQIMHQASHYCEMNGITINDIPEPIKIERNDYEIMTHTITLKGSFHSLVKFLYELEQNWSLGNTSSVKFYTQKEVRTKKKSLYLSIYIQNVKRIQN